MDEINAITQLFAEWLKRSEAVDAAEESGVNSLAFLAAIHKEFLAFIATIDMTQATSRLQE